MNELARELNETLRAYTPGRFLSPMGERLYFPKGIVAQSAEAGSKAKAVNATVGLATKNGQPMHLSDIYDSFRLGAFQPNEIFSYAPGGGDKRLRALWKEDMIKKNPSLEGKVFSEPLVTAGLTHAISIVAELFIPHGADIVCPNLFWDNYDLIFSELVDGNIIPFTFFNEHGGFNVKGMKDALLSCKGNAARIILNFPNNPTGYTPNKKEADEIVEALKEVAEKKYVMVIIDDAYFGLFYEDETNKESLFAKLVDADEKIFVVKGDAATKEEMVWGFRIGFLTYGGKGLDDTCLEALTKKTLGAIRATVSNCDRPGQSLLLKAMKDGRNYEEDKKKLFNEMKVRYSILKRELEKYRDNAYLKAYPFNSGYFMGFDTLGRSAEELREHLLDKYGVGVINIFDKTLRVAYCSVEPEAIGDLVALIYRAAEELWSSR